MNFLTNESFDVNFDHLISKEMNGNLSLLHNSIEGKFILSHLINLKSPCICSFSTSLFRNPAPTRLPFKRLKFLSALCFYRIWTAVGLP